MRVNDALYFGASLKPQTHLGKVDNKQRNHELPEQRSRQLELLCCREARFGDGKRFWCRHGWLDIVNFIRLCLVRRRHRGVFDSGVPESIGGRQEEKVYEAHAHRKYLGESIGQHDT